MHATKGTSALLLIIDFIHFCAASHLVPEDSPPFFDKEQVWMRVMPWLPTMKTSAVTRFRSSSPQLCHQFIPALKLEFTSPSTAICATVWFCSVNPSTEMIQFKHSSCGSRRVIATLVSAFLMNSELGCPEIDH